jgi:hypothetical protein
MSGLENGGLPKRNNKAVGGGIRDLTFFGRECNRKSIRAPMMIENRTKNKDSTVEPSVAAIFNETKE